MRALLLAALLAPALAGCLGQSEPAVLPPPPELGLPGYLYACAGGAPQEAPCLADLARDDATLQEPYAAIDPRDPAIMAIGVNLGPPLAERAQGAPQGRNEVCRYALYITEDGGSTWREAVAPYPPLDTGMLGPAATPCGGDPAHVFDGAGRLHATGIAAPIRAEDNLEPVTGMLGLGESVGFRTFYVRSDDLGKTWGEPVWVSDNGMSQDRNWITRDPATETLFVIWQNTHGPLAAWTVELAWSTDNGTSWRNQAEAQRSPCHSMGPLVLSRGEALFACSNSSAEEERRVRVYAFDPASGAATLRGELVQDGLWPLLAALPDGQLVLRYETPDGDNVLLWSADGGRTWANPQSLRGLAQGTWLSAHAYWMASDALGGVHLLVQLRTPEASPLGEASDSVQMRHLVLDARGEKAQETLLAAWTTKDPATVRPAQALGDHYYGLAFEGERGLLVFTRDAALKLTMTVPKAG